MDDDDLVNSIGLLLTQLRYTRRAMEDIERSTARYAGFAFAAALSEGPSFGAPPMFEGALKVHIVNINDLAPGSGFGGFLESLLGGVGRLIGGLPGSFAAGLIAGFNLPGMILRIQSIADTIERILIRLGISLTENKDKDKAKDKDNKKPSADLATQLKDVKDIAKAFTALFEAASSPDKAGKTLDPLTPAGERWLAILRTADSLIRGATRVIEGLVILIPIAIGALASVIVHLRDIQAAVLGLLQFLLKELFLLRGVVLFTLYDTIAAAARLGAGVLSILGGALQTILTSISNLFVKLFDASLDILKFLASGLKATVDALLKWLIDAVGTVLLALGDSKIFRVVVHLVQVLPAVLPPLVLLVREVTIDTTDLKKAADLVIKDPQFTGKLSDSIPIPEFPDLSTTLAPKTDVGALGDKLSKAFDGVKTDLASAFESSIGALGRIGDTLDNLKKDESFLKALETRENTLRTNATALADALSAAQSKLAERPETGLEKIATAYEDWLKGKGLETIVDNINAFFAKSSDTSAIMPTPVPPDRPRATVEIKELVIDLGTPKEKAPEPGAPIVEAAYTPDKTGFDIDEYHEKEHELAVRGRTRTSGSPLLWG
ncbi:hypothetical protein [Sorangium sp. So ce1000]|uniref:hypothetical protein n=1 Tax=Sorangium sp. So ce1000 TaxID=3133325 RepID=UPI003F617A0E